MFESVCRWSCSALCVLSLVFYYGAVLNKSLAFAWLGAGSLVAVIALLVLAKVRGWF